MIPINYNGINIAAVNVNITDNDFQVVTGSGRDPLTGTAANDRIVGGAGAKTITGGLGNDIMSGYMTVIKYSVETLHVTSLHCGYYG
ncbi:MAG: hypothetical protein ACFKPT_00475 [Gloeotrichia echinulata GP01]